MIKQLASSFHRGLSNARLAAQYEHSGCIIGCKITHFSPYSKRIFPKSCPFPWFESCQIIFLSLISLPWPHLFVFPKMRTTFWFIIKYLWLVSVYVSAKENILIQIVKSSLWRIFLSLKEYSSGGFALLSIGWLRKAENIPSQAFKRLKWREVISFSFMLNL